MKNKKKGFLATLKEIDPLKQTLEKTKEIITLSVDRHSDLVTDRHSDLVTDRHSDLVTDRHSDTSSSSVLYNKLLLKLFKKKDINTTYWKNKGLTEKQLVEWIKLVNCDESTMLNYLSYCRFEMVDLGVEESKPVENVLNWFYKILERTGGYPKPKGYKSFEEKRLEEEQEALAEKKLLVEKQKRIYEEKIKAERDADFYEMMNNPESEMYLKCFERLNKFTKRRTGTKAFEMGMRGAYDEIVEAQ